VRPETVRHHRCGDRMPQPQSRGVDCSAHLKQGGRGMAAFTVWKFDSPDGAEAASSVLTDAASEGLIKILDHAVVSWPMGASRPSTHQGHEEAWRGTGWGALWGVLVGALFFVPVIGGVAGAAIGAISKATEGAGIGKDQLETIRTQVTEGTSALFVVTDEGNLDRVGERFHGMHSKLIATNLTDAERRALLATFGGN
jgi:uncharacterized membrane protein